MLNVTGWSPINQPYVQAEEHASPAELPTTSFTNPTRVDVSVTHAGQQAGTRVTDDKPETVREPLTVIFMDRPQPLIELIIRRLES